MKIEFDPRKDASIRRKHSISLALSKEFDWRHEIAWVDKRFAYDECRMICLIAQGDTLYVAVYVDRGDVRRMISLRKANRREVTDYARDNQDY
ncbi:BrnT family toxin [Pseudoduganella eburnea]|uniref:BrnT family toxin n=1 Tax=Massilia eburnea TaxID=1776165 RepID=A0A6L6QIU9_9BURK|nr:BrnT family toxin [Massilia eburnea]